MLVDWSFLKRRRDAQQGCDRSSMSNRTPRCGLSTYSSTLTGKTFDVISHNCDEPVDVSSDAPTSDRLET